MADVSMYGVDPLITLLMGQGDIRRESSEGISRLRRDNAKDHSDLNDGVKTSAWAVSDRVGTEADRVVGQSTAYFIASQSQNFSNATALAALKASTDAAHAKTQADIALAAATAAAASVLAGEKVASAAALGQALIGQQIIADGNATRELVNRLKGDQLNRELIERNAFLVEERGNGRFWHGRADVAQFAAVTSQLNALGSQLQETRQGMVNFGSMTGVGQTSTSNNA